MQRFRIIIGELAFPAETVRIEPLERGRLALFVRSPMNLFKGASCTARASDGEEMDCVVVEIYPDEPGGSVIELRCLAKAAL